MIRITFIFKVCVLRSLNECGRLKRASIVKYFYSNVYLQEKYVCLRNVAYHAAQIALYIKQIFTPLQYHL